MAPTCNVNKTGTMKKKPGLARIGELVATGVALIAEPVSGSLSLLARLASLAGDQIQATQSHKLLDRVSSIEERAAALEATALPTRRLRGKALRLLIACLECETSALFAGLEFDQAMESLELSADEHREAAEELELLGLVKIDWSGNAPAGVQRTRLQPVGYVAVGSILLPDVSVAEEGLRVLQAIADSESDSVMTLVSNLTDKLKDIPLPRLDLTIRALDELGLISAGGPGHQEYGSFHHVSVTTAGKRVLRGDDPLL